MPKKFWLVWSNSSWCGTRRTTYEHAKKDAEDLARQHIGIKFYVLEALDYRMVSPPPIVEVKL